MAMASLPISSATARAPSRLRSAMATFAPSLAIRMAVAFPSPEAPPVIRATLLDARPIVCFLLLSLPQDSRVAGRGANMTPRQGGQFGRGLIRFFKFGGQAGGGQRSEEHTSELQSLMRTSYAVF